MKTVFFSLVIFYCLCGLISYGQAADPSMVLYLPMDENEGDTAYDLSEYKNDAALKGKAKWAPGKYESGVELGTSNYLEVKDSDSLDITDALTISCWVRIMGLTGDNQSGIEKGAAWAVGEYNLLPEYGGGVLLQIFDLPEACNDDAIAGSIVDQEWHYVTGTWDGKTIIIYIDGEESRTMACKGKLGTNNDSLYIGCRGGSGRWVDGFMDEIKIYNRALSVDEIKVDMETPRANLAVDVVGKLAVTWGNLKVDF